MDDSVIWKWVLNAAAILGGGMWLGRSQLQINQNKDDIRELKRRSVDVAQISERVARVEEQLRSQSSKIDDIHRAVISK